MTARKTPKSKAESAICSEATLAPGAAKAASSARAADWSWDRISAALGGSPNGETLRRNFGGETH
jgi:hypothetical protein